MSHAATNWAIRQRGLKPAAKIVLWHLADCHNAHSGQCNPRQSVLAEMCEMSRSTLNLHLAKLEALGLIQRVATTDEKTKQQQATRYILAFDATFKAVSENEDQPNGGLEMDLEMPAPCPKTGQGAVSENKPIPCPKNDRPRVLKSDSYKKNPGKEPGSRTGKSVRDDVRILEILSSVISPSVAADFVDLRKRKRAVITERAAELIVKDLTNHPNPDAVVEASIKAGWTGIFPDRFGATNGQSSSARRPSGSASAGRDQQSHGVHGAILRDIASRGH